MDALILAGGFGTRLQSVVKDVPKPMAPIQDTPFLALLVRHLKKHGVTRVILATHYLHDVIEGFMGTSFEGVTVQYAHEATPLGTGGAIVNAIHQFGITRPVLVLNGDTFVKLDYAAMVAQHNQASSTFTIALRHIPDTGRSGVVAVENGHLQRFGERGQPGQPGLINAGVYIINPQTLKGFAPGQAFSLEKDFLEPQTPTLQPTAFMAEGYFIDIGVPDDYARAQAELSRHM